jgi:hypothetical protein
VEGKDFVVARNLARSDLLVDAAGKPAAVAGVTERRGRFAVYNFEVEGTHTYHAGPGGWWVHNDCTLEALRLQQRHGGEIYRLQPPGNELIPGTDWYYHDVLKSNGMIYDPMRNYHNPIPLDSWMSSWNDSRVYGYSFAPASPDYLEKMRHMLD